MHWIVFFFQAEDGIRDVAVTGVQTCALPISVPMAIPTDYIDNANLRMEVYRKIASGEVEPEAMLAELRDRFGPPRSEERRVGKEGRVRGALVQHHRNTHAGRIPHQPRYTSVT